MTLHFEVINRFQAAASADALLYTPLNAGLTFRRSRVYTVEITGDGQKAREYLLSVLVDPISQECTEQNAPILEPAPWIWKKKPSCKTTAGAGIWALLWTA